MPEPDPPVRIGIVAAYGSSRAELHALLADVEGFAIVVEASGSAELSRLLPSAPCDVVVFDFNRDDAVHVREVVAGAFAALLVIDDAVSEFAWLAGEGAPGWAWLSRDADALQIAAAIRAVSSGLIVLDPAVGPILRPHEGPASSQHGERRDDTLTAREREVLQWMAAGLPNKNIAARLNVSLHTVKFHVASILAKLGAGSRTEAVTIAARRGYILL